MGHLYHGYVSHNQRVNESQTSLGNLDGAVEFLFFGGFGSNIYKYLAS
jgi:hypothetical protein